MSIEINCKNYSNFQRIKTGNYGIMYRAKDKNTGLYVAIKEIFKEKFNQLKDILERDVAIMKKNSK